jgi:hypothetical protein
LEGNFAIVNNQNVYTVDTRLSTITPDMVSTEEAPVVEAIPSQTGEDVGARYQPAWIIPTLIFAVAVILVTLLIVAYRGWSGNAARKMEKPAKKAS